MSFVLEGIPSYKRWCTKHGFIGFELVCPCFLYRPDLTEAYLYADENDPVMQLRDAVLKARRNDEHEPLQLSRTKHARS